jgi:hypothetical protein
MWDRVWSRNSADVQTLRITALPAPCTAAISIDDNGEIEEVILNSDLNQCDIIYFER